MNNKQKSNNQTKSKLAEMPEGSQMQDILKALKEDHDALRKFGEVLKSDDASLSEKKEAYKNFSTLLKSHSKSEEKAVYDPCLEVEDIKQEAHEGYIEHSIADSLMAKIGTTRNEDKWQAMVKVLAEVVEHHADEEEKELLPDVKKEFEKEEQKDMVHEFISLREKSQTNVNSENAGILAHIEGTTAQSAM